MDRRVSSVHEWITTCGGIGLLPVMPGTWCSIIVALPGFFVTDPLMGQTLYAVSCVVLLVLGYASTKHVQATWGADPTEVVVDEAVGMSLIMTIPIVYTGWEFLLGAVFLFRVFDVFKPWPISLINNKSSAFSVMFDDIVAAVFAMMSLYLGSSLMQGLLVFLVSM